MTDELKQWEYEKGYEKGRADTIKVLLETQKYDELSQKIAIDILERGIAKGRADAIVEFVTRFEYENITDANAERLKPFIYEMHRLAEKMQKGAENE